MSQFVGLKNQGATCYLNSLIQTLFLTPEFRQQLFSVTDSSCEIIVNLQKLMARLQSPDLISSYCPMVHALSTKHLTNSFGWHDNQAFNQEDINELYNLLVNGIEARLNNNEKILHKFYTGRLTNVIECQNCNYTSIREDDFNQMNVILQNNKETFDSLQESMMSMYFDNDEEMKEDNAYFCPNCNAKVPAKKYCRLSKLPSILVCNLNRFRYDLELDSNVKINRKFKFPKSLDLSMFVEHEYSQMNKEMCDYDLIAVVVHSGGANGGHYHALIRDIHHEGDWNPVQRKKKKRNGRMDSNTTNNKHGDTEQKKREKAEEATSILVHILKKHGILTKNRLQNEFKKNTNWNGWYTYEQLGLGSFAQFLLNNDRLEVINRDKRNFSVDLPHNSNDLNGFIVCDGDGTDDEYMPQQNTNQQPICTQIQEEEEEEEHKCNDANAPHWFDFNDEDITPVFDTEIDELQSNKKECAYMLVYRNKQLQTAHSNWPPSIPEIAKQQYPQIEDNYDNGSYYDICELYCDGDSFDSFAMDDSLGDSFDDSFAFDDSFGDSFELYCDDDSPPNNQEEARPNNQKAQIGKKRKYREFAQNTKPSPNEPPKKKRKVASSTNAPHPNRKRKCKKRKAKAVHEQIQSKYLEGRCHMKKDASVSELYSRVSEWTGIASQDLSIAQYTCNHISRISHPDTSIITYNQHDKGMIKHNSDIFVWNSAIHGTQLLRQLYIIQFRIKSCKIKLKESQQKKLIISGNESVRTVFERMCSAFEVDHQQFEMRKACTRSQTQWMTSTAVDDKYAGVISDSLSNQYSRLILVQKSWNKHMRHIICEYNGIEFGFDIDKRKKCEDVKRRIIEERGLQLNIGYQQLRLSVLSRAKGQWHIMKNSEKLGETSVAKHKYLVELSNKAYAEQGGNKSGGKCLIFVHRMISTDAEGAVYGPRHEIEITRSQREKRDALQSKIMKELGIENDQIVTIAIKVGVEWKIISQKPFPYHKPFDRSVVGVAVGKKRTCREFATKTDKEACRKPIHQLHIQFTQCITDNGKECVESGPIDTNAKSKAAPKKQKSGCGAAFSKFNKAVALPYRDDNNLKHEQYEQLDIDFDNNSWAQQPHLKSRSKPKQSAPKTTDAKPKESEKKQKDESVEEVDSKPTKTEQDTDALAVTEQVNEDTDALVITKQATDAVMAGQTADNNEQAIVAVDESSEPRDAFPDTPNEPEADDVQIQMDDDEIVVKVSDEEEEEEVSQSSTGTQEDKAHHAKVGAAVRVTLQSARDSAGTEYEDGSEEDRDVMGDLASVRVEIDTNLKHKQYEQLDIDFNDKLKSLECEFIKKQQQLHDEYAEKRRRLIEEWMKQRGTL